MGIKERVKRAASTVSYGAGRAARLARAQVALNSMKRELDAAEKQLAEVALDLFEQGRLPVAALRDPFLRLRKAKVAVAAKEAEIAVIKLKAEEEPVVAPDAGDAAEAPDHGAGTKAG